MGMSAHIWLYPANERKFFGVGPCSFVFQYVKHLKIAIIQPEHIYAHKAERGKFLRRFSSELFSP